MHRNLDVTRFLRVKGETKKVLLLRFCVKQNPIKIVPLSACQCVLYAFFLETVAAIDTKFDGYIGSMNYESEYIL